MTKKQKKLLTRILVAAGLLAAVWIADRLWIPGTWLWLRLAAYLVPYGVAGYDVVKKAVTNIGRGQVFDENFLMTVATVGALTVGFLPGGETEFPEGVFVMLFYQVGELFQSLAVGRSRRSIGALMALRPDEAHWVTDDGVRDVDPETIPVDATIVVRPGERVPLDGVVTEGRSSLNTVALTGESQPRPVEPGDSVLAGCVNGGGTLTLRVTRVFGESAVARILELVENAASNKSRSEAFLTRFARWYTPGVVGAAALLAVLPPLFQGGGWAVWLGRALTFLVVSCPCALVISVPLAFFAGIGGASRRGILVKGSQFMEALSKAEICVFDKTGTLTEGVFEVVAIHPNRWNADALLRLTAMAESGSDHPVAQSLCRAWGGTVPQGAVAEVTEVPGKGLSAQVEGHAVLVGNGALLTEAGLEAPECHRVGTIIHVAVDGEYAGHVVISDRIKENARGLIPELKKAGVAKTVMLTGDRPEVAESVAAELGLDEWHAGLLPGDKVGQVERLLCGKKSGTLLFVGDGINDAPVLTRADVGVAMGAMGTDAAIEAADVVLMDDDPRKLAQAVTLSRRTMRIVRENIGFALGVKAAILVLGALGITGMWMAVFADVGVCVLAILNSFRNG